eukprot:jgi/Chlat1/6267/Chrsp44S09051
MTMFKKLFHSSDHKSSNSHANGNGHNAKADGSDNNRSWSDIKLYHISHQAAVGTARSLLDFEVGPILGTGSFGRVSIAKHKATDCVCAIKCLSKSQILKTKQVNHIKAEKEILSCMDFPFVVNMLGSFQDKKCLYIVMEYVCGGEFFTHLRALGRFPEAHARIYASEVLLVFEYLHEQNIIYRDLKPENLLLDNQGHVKVTDFGFAKRIDHRTYTLCGTPDYLAPEIILNKGHGKPVDWWAFGVLIYEMLAGYPPFYDEDPMGTYQKILSGKVYFPSHFSRSAKDLIKKLLQQDLTKRQLAFDTCIRYGNLKGGVKDIKSHPFFGGVEWGAVVALEVPPPLKPTVKAADDTSNFDDYSELGPMSHEYELTSAAQELFSDF